VEFPVLGKNLVSVEIIQLDLPMNSDDSLEMLKYREELERIARKNEQEKWKATKRPELPFNHELESKKWSLTGDLEWIRTGLSKKEAERVSSSTENRPDRLSYIGLVMKPGNAEPITIEELFGEAVLDSIYRHMLEIEKRYPENKFNSYFYRPELKRHFLWGVNPEGLLIYYGNEGEFRAYYKTLIPFAQVPALKDDSIFD
jgi:hypothetical protein